MDASELLNQARKLSDAGKNRQAREALRYILAADNQNEEAWLLFADVAEKPADAIKCLQNALRINPGNAAASENLANQISKRDAPSLLSRILSACISKVGCAVFITIIFGVGVCIIGYSIIWDTGKKDIQANDTRASIICKQLVESQLKSPSTAKFAPWEEERHFTLKGYTDAWKINGYVDATNGFGTTIRTNYTCEIQYKYVINEWTDLRNWKLIDLIFE